MQRDSASLLTEHYDNRRRAAMEFERACRLQFSAGCDNAVAFTQGAMFKRDAPTAARLPVHLARQQGPIQDQEPAQLYARACVQGWPDTCGIR